MRTRHRVIVRRRWLPRRLRYHPATRWVATAMVLLVAVAVVHRTAASAAQERHRWGDTRVVAVARHRIPSGSVIDADALEPEMHEKRLRRAVGHRASHRSFATANLDPVHFHQRVDRAFRQRHAADVDRGAQRPAAITPRLRPARSAPNTAPGSTTPTAGRSPPSTRRSTRASSPASRARPTPRRCVSNATPRRRSMDRRWRLCTRFRLVYRSPAGRC